MRELHESPDVAARRAQTAGRWTRGPARPDLTIVLHNPVPDTDTAAKLEWLTSQPPQRHAHGGYPDRMSDELPPDDRKIITLARSARARNGVPEGAAVRDETGRTYVAGTVALDSLKLSALRTAVAMAVASGATSLEAAAVVTGAEGVSAEDLAAVRDLGGPATPVYVAAPDGVVGGSVSAG